MMYLYKIFKHLTLVLKHKWFVFLAACEGGIPIRGFFHDMSKFSPIEFLNSAKYYTGDRSPIDNEKDAKGYSYAWLHHRGRNPHHWEYWIDNLSGGGDALMVPYKFLKEMICDWIGAGKAYNFKEWTRKTPIEFFDTKAKKGQIKMNSSSLVAAKFILKEYSESQKSLKTIFNEYETIYISAFNIWKNNLI